jgi:hypothetical protein
MALSPELIKRRRRTELPRAPPYTLGVRVSAEEVLPPFPLPPVGGVLPKLTVLGRTFRQTVPASTAVILSMRCPLNGRITELNPHFPPGCLSLVLMRFGTDRHGQCFPDTGYIALDNATPVFKVNISVDYDERLWMEIWNQDAGNAHTPSLSLTVEGR